MKEARDVVTSGRKMIDDNDRPGVLCLGARGVIATHLATTEQGYQRPPVLAVAIYCARF